jgi:hypothetical protein
MNTLFEMLEQYNAFVPVKKIAKQFDVSVFTFYQILKRNNIPLRGSICKQDIIDKVHELFCQGVRTKEISDICGIDKKTVGTYLRKKDVPKMKTRLKLEPHIVEYILKQFKNGKSVGRLCAELHCASSTIRMVIDKARHDALNNPVKLPRVDTNVSTLENAKNILGKRLECTSLHYFLDGKPTNLTEIMRTTNGLLKEHNLEQIGRNTNWFV